VNGFVMPSMVPVAATAPAARAYTGPHWLSVLPLNRVGSHFIERYGAHEWW
jgi:hypothetical protein